MTLLSEKQKDKLQKLYNQNRFSELELEVEKISDFKTRSPFLANLLGVAKLKKKFKTDKDWLEARSLFLDSYTKAPTYDDALCNYAHISVKLRDFDHAYNELIKRKKRGYNPKINEALSRIYFFEGKIDDALTIFKETEKNGDLTPVTASHFLTTMNYSSNFSQKEYLNYCRKIDNKFEVASDELKKRNKYNLSENLKIGFISPDLMEHSVYYFLKSTFQSLKKNSIKIYAFNLRDESELDDISKQIKKNCDKWIDLSKLNDLDAANLIVKNNINILIDLAGHFARNRFKILKYKPSPIQISWMGFVNTTGIKELDYILADQNLIKSDEENLYSEKVLRLPNIWNCHSGIDDKFLINEPPFKKNGYLTFGCFNNSSKISPDCINIWSEILKKAKNCKIMIKAPSEDAEIAQRIILDKFKKNKIDEDRILFEKKKKNRDDHLKMYNGVDVSLDTFPYPGVTTSFESIWMGVPVLTKAGNNFVSRCGESININLGMKDFIATDNDDYILKATSLCENFDYITKIRKTLRDKAKNSPLFDVDKFGNDFSELMINLWKKNSE